MEHVKRMTSRAVESSFATPAQFIKTDGGKRPDHVTSRGTLPPTASVNVRRRVPVQFTFRCPLARFPRDGLARRRNEKGPLLGSPFRLITAGLAGVIHTIWRTSGGSGRARATRGANRRHPSRRRPRRQGRRNSRSSRTDSRNSRSYNTRARQRRRLRQTGPHRIRPAPLQAPRLPLTAPQYQVQAPAFSLCPPVAVALKKRNAKRRSDVPRNMS